MLDAALFRFQQIIRAVETEIGLSKLDPVARQILQIVGEKEFAHEQLFVGNIITLTDLGAPVTISNRLKELQRDGWVVLERDAENHRKKHVRLTARGVDALNRLSQSIRSGMSKLERTT